MKVALVGAGCVGKTTVAQQIAAQSPTPVVTVQEAARDWFDQHPGLSTRERFGIDAQAAVQTLQWQREVDAHAGTWAAERTLIVCDRSVLDAAVYVHTAGDPRGGRRLWDRARWWLPTYDRLFLLAPDHVPHTADGVRDEGAADRAGLHAGFVQCLGRWSVPYTLVAGVTVDGRVGQVLTACGVSGDWTPAGGQPPTGSHGP